MYKIIIHYIHKTMTLAWDTCVKTCKISETKTENVTYIKKKTHNILDPLLLLLAQTSKYQTCWLIDRNPPTPSPFHRGGSEFSVEVRPYNRSKDSLSQRGKEEQGLPICTWFGCVIKITKSFVFWISNKWVHLFNRTKIW